MPRTIKLFVHAFLIYTGLLIGPLTVFAQEPTPEPWLNYFQQQVALVEQETLADLRQVTPDNWTDIQAEWRAELREMLGIPADIRKTDLKSTTVGSISLEGVTVDRLHYQSRPGLYVGANLYRPKTKPPEGGFPAVLYVCGHARVTDGGRALGNKTNYQHHGLWLARHGVVCLTIDTVQLGEFHGEHHGTYKLGRWDWMSRGYTPAGVEAWNAIRGVDLLTALPEVNASQIGITGRSGGGVYSWYAAALDDRIRAAVPVAGITDLQNYVIDGCVEGHCDCMFFANLHRWDYAKLAALVAPRALLLANSDTDRIFPLDGVLRIERELRDLYARLGQSEKYGLVITPGPHKDTQDLQIPAFKWLVKHLTGTEILIDTPALKEIDFERLAVFTKEIPKNERVTSAGNWFVSLAQPIKNAQQATQKWDKEWFVKLKRIGVLPREPIEEPLLVESGQQTIEDRNWQLFTCEQPSGLAVLKLGVDSEQPPIVHLVLQDSIRWSAETLESITSSNRVKSRLAAFPDRAHFFVRWRGASWMENANSVKQRNQIARRFYLLGQTPEQVALLDYMAVSKWLARSQAECAMVEPAAAGREALICQLAALTLTSANEGPKIQRLHLASSPVDPSLASSLLGFLQVCPIEGIHAAIGDKFDVRSFAEKSPSQALLVDSSSEPQQAGGMRIVEVDQDSAKVRVRATRWSLPNLGDLPRVQFQEPATRSKRNVGAILPESGVAGLQYGVPGVPAEVRAGYRKASGGGWQYAEWQSVSADTDFSAVIELSELEASTEYAVRTQVRATGVEGPISSLSGQFKTLPAAETEADFRLAVGTCQAFIDRDGPHGFDLYRTLLRRSTDAFVMAGDVVYYDSLARSNELAYYHWQRTYSRPTLVEFHKRVPTYFLKDDHDTYVNDSWPGQQHDWTGDFTFESGQKIFIQETGLPNPAYRTFVIGSNLQIWLMEGRDYRSPNTDPDGPAKSIWGEAQKSWLAAGLKASKAKFKVVISPTPIVGPDRDNKRDNHSNKVFETEGREVRSLLSSYPNTISVCGDRHWQFHSVDPVTGLHEFSVGPASERHAGGWKQQDYRPDIHQYLRVGGGYLELDLQGAGDDCQLILRHLDTHGQEHHRHTLR